MTDTNQDLTLSGGLPDMTIPQSTAKNDTTQTTTQPSATTTEESKKFVVGDRVFYSAEEALAYASGLASAQSKAAAVLNRTEDPVQQPAPVKLGQLLFDNPDEALAVVEQRALDRFTEQQRKVEENKNFWNTFYETHPDLKGSGLLVDAVLKREQMSGSFSNLTWAESAPIIAAKAREEVSRIRNVQSGGQALPSKPAVVAGASGSPTPQPTTPPTVKTDFVTEMRNMRKRG